ncbi:hypothetical protein [Burkholderia ambifaria]|uniref:hypothetical protein n=1 Tax=Burkholderia ambifaria TaxID=152480 RepID=UPI0012FD885B|nr:hypothetical protein [Burkholderia ambifaria]
MHANRASEATPVRVVIGGLLRTEANAQREVRHSAKFAPSSALQKHIVVPVSIEGVNSERIRPIMAQRPYGHDPTLRVLRGLLSPSELRRKAVYVMVDK